MTEIDLTKLSKQVESIAKMTQQLKKTHKKYDEENKLYKTIHKIEVKWGYIALAALLIGMFMGFVMGWQLAQDHIVTVVNQSVGYLH